VISTAPPVFVSCWYSISGTIHNFWHDPSTLQIKVCEAETIALTPSDPSLPPLSPITQCREGGATWYVDVSRVFAGDLPTSDLTYTVGRLCAGEYIVAPVYSAGDDLCEWHGSWRSALGQAVRLESASASGYDFTFEPDDSHAPAITGIIASPEQPEMREDVEVTILADDDIGIAAIWLKTDTVFFDGSYHPGIWESLTITPGLEGSTAGAAFSITDDEVAEATVTAKVCDAGGNSHMARKVITFGSCHDGARNQGETGVDCGGPCPSECKECLGDWSIGTGPSSYLYSPEQMTFIRSMALSALVEFADVHSGVDLFDLDTSDEYIDAVSWWVARHMKYRGDDLNGQCLNDVAGLGYEPSDYDHGDFPVPAYYTLTYSALALASDPSKWFYGDCEDFAILESALLRSLGVSHLCVFNAEGPGHGYNVVNHQSKYKILEPQTNVIGMDERTGMYNLYNVWNDSIGSYASSDFGWTWPWEYTLNYPGCEGPTVSATGGGFGEKTLWLDWDGWQDNVQAAVGDFDGDGRDDIAAVWYRGSDAYNKFDTSVLRSTGAGFALPDEPISYVHAGDFTPFTVGTAGQDYVVGLIGDTMWCAIGTPGECRPASGHTNLFASPIESGEWLAIGDPFGDTYSRVGIIQFHKGDRTEVTVGSKDYPEGTVWATGFSPGDEIPLVGDFDGDGLDDVISFENRTWGGVRVARSVPEEDRFCAHELWHRSFGLDQQPGVGDFNGDGRDDIVSFARDSTASGCGSRTSAEVGTPLSSVILMETAETTSHACPWTATG
jgi:hypothetical protein